VACLIADKGCKWNSSLSENSCSKDDSLQTNETFWQTWDENDFNEDFIKKFFEE
jgi:hypothetical protein